MEQWQQLDLAATRSDLSGDLRHSSELARWIRPGSVVYDIGPGHGAYALAASRYVGRGGKVILFEADSFRAARLRELLLQQRILNVEIKQVLLGQLAIMPPKMLSPSGVRGARSDAMSPADSLDNLRAEGRIPPAQVVRLAVGDAAAADALAGGAGFFQTCQPIVFAPLTPGETQEAVRRILDGWGYEPLLGGLAWTPGVLRTQGALARMIRQIRAVLGRPAAALE